MKLEEVDWEGLKKLSGEELINNIFQIFTIAARDVQLRKSDDPILLGLVPRVSELLALKPEIKTCAPMLSSLARALGLWNYIDDTNSDFKDDLIVEFATLDRIKIVMHREQLKVFETLSQGQNVILSAPTSFGKSLIVDALLCSPRYKKIAIILPTIALLDEFRRRLLRQFGRRFEIIMHHSETPVREEIIFLGTQERLLNRDDIDDLDLLVVDEFYKLDPSRDDERSLLLNAAAFKLAQKSKQFFFLGPNIQGVDRDEKNPLHFAFVHTRFSTVAVDTFDLSDVVEKFDRLVLEIRDKKNFPALIFVSSPNKANELLSKIIAKYPHVDELAELAQWIDQYYGPGWQMSAAISAGIGVHHGRIPRALAARIVSLFNSGKMNLLICTSTLIEGVNTAAKSVFIYDNKINRRDVDFFTFSNIRGRAGRLGRHFVGRVFLFDTAPDPTDTIVSAPLFGEFDSGPDEFVVHVDEGKRSRRLSERVTQLASNLGLAEHEARKFVAIGVEKLREIRDVVNEEIKNGNKLAWQGYPDFGNVLAICKIVDRVDLIRKFGALSAKQLAFYITRLRSIPTLREFFRIHAATYIGPDREAVFRFLRAAEHRLPELISAIELYVKKIRPEADYSLFLAELPRWFKLEPLKILEEQGIPIQISERFIKPSDSVEGLADRLRNRARNGDLLLSRLEREWILDALPNSEEELPINR